jgi:hypothetical protein
MPLVGIGDLHRQRLGAIVIRSALAAAAFVLAGAVNYDPVTLAIGWEDGTVARYPVTAAATCDDAVRALLARRWRPDIDTHGAVVAAWCEPGNLFPPERDCQLSMRCRR